MPFRVVSVYFMLFRFAVGSDIPPRVVSMHPALELVRKYPFDASYAMLRVMVWLGLTLMVLLTVVTVLCARSYRG